MIIVLLFALISAAKAEKLERELRKDPFIVPFAAQIQKIANTNGHQHNHSCLEEMSLRGTLVAGAQSIANINGEMFKKGQLVHGYMIKEVHVGKVILERLGKRQELVVDKKYEKIR